MNKITSILLLLYIPFFSWGQTKIEKLTRPIVAEGKLLYRAEMASWYGTDLFLEKFKDRKKVGGYFSYTEEQISKCIFFSKGDTPVVIGTISFDATYDLKAATIDLTERAFSKNENDLLVIRQLTLNEIDKDTLFKTYKNTNLNLIPLISNGEKKVYILTGPTEHGVVVFGNDYLLTFDNDNQLITKKQLHKNILPINYGTSKEGEEIHSTIHSHLPETGDFITATDICTLMLYEKFTKWKQHSVISANYMSIWDCQTDELTVITKDLLDKIDKDQKKRQKKEKKKKAKKNSE